MPKTRTIEVATTVVTDIRIERDGRLLAHAVDQDEHGGTVASHDLNEAADDLPAPIKAAIHKIREHISDWAEKA